MTVILSEAILIVSAVLTLLFSGNLIAVFRNDPDVISIGTSKMLYYCIPKARDLPVAKARIATEELYKMIKAKKAMQKSRQKVDFF